MTQSHNDRVGDHFALKVRDWTPASMSHAARVLYAPFSNNPEISKYCASILSDDELMRANRFLTETGKSHFIQRRAFRRYCGSVVQDLLGASPPFSQIDFEETRKGRPHMPHLPNFSFSFSACRSGFLGAWSETHGIGIDIEDQARELEASELAQRFFSKAEAKAVKEAAENARLRTFYQFWCLKEAALKSIGEGLPFGLDAFEFTLTPELTIVEAPLDHGGRERFEARLIEQADNCAALVARKFN